MKKNEIKNMTIYEYVEDLSNLYDELVKNYGELILKKLKDGEKLSELELYFIASQLNILERDNNGKI